MYPLRMVKICLNYGARREIRMEGNQMVETVRQPFSVGRLCVEMDRDKAVQAMVSEYGVPDSIEFHSHCEPIQEINE